MTTITPQLESDLQKLVDLRAELEVFAARQLVRIPGGKAALTSDLTRILAALKQSVVHRDYAQFDEADYRLHETLIRLANVPTLLEIWRIVWKALAEFHRHSLEKHWPDLRVLMDEHEYLVKALCSMDEAATVDGVRSHLRAIWFRIAEQRGDFMREGDPLLRASAYLAFHLHRPVRLQRVAAKVAFCSPGHLSKLFRDHYGMGFQAYLQNLRLEKAADLLAQSNLSVAMVARRSGYHDVSRFCLHFRRKFGGSPLQWRHRRQNSKKTPASPGG